MYQRSAFLKDSLAARLPLIALVLLSIIWTWLFIHNPIPPRVGQDYFPIWLGGRLIMSGQSPYGSAVQAYLKQVWDHMWGQAGNAYPLPSIVPWMLLSLLPIALASLCWMCLGVGGLVAALFLRPDWRRQLPLLFLFAPIQYAMALQQATLIWVATAAIALLALRHQRWFLAGLCLAILPTKPQAGLIFAFAIGLWAWRHERRVLLWGGLWSLVFWGGALLLRPSWFVEWWAAVEIYHRLLPGTYLLPLGLGVLLLTIRQPWWAIAAVAQVVIFPVNDMYSNVPLLFAWIAIGGPLAWVGSAISWAWLLLDWPGDAYCHWLYILLPYCVCVGWSTYQRARANRLLEPSAL